MRNLFLFVLISVPAYSQPDSQNVERVLHFKHTESTQDLQALVTVVRTITGIGKASLDSTLKTFTLHASAGQVATAEWLFNQLDQPVKQQAATSFITDTGDLVQVFYLSNLLTNQELQEAVTVVRTTVELRNLFVYNPSRAIVVRGSAADVRLAAWLLKAFDLPANRLESAPHVNESGDLIQVFYFTQPLTHLELVEVATVVRSTGDLRRLFVYSPSRAIVVRGSAADLRLAGWLLKEFDQPANRPGFAPRVNEYRLLENDDDILKVFYLAPTNTVRRMQEIATEVRSTVQIPRLFTNNVHRAIVVRGTTAQLARAAQLIEQQGR